MTVWSAHEDHASVVSAAGSYVMTSFFTRLIVSLSVLGLVSCGGPEPEMTASGPVILVVSGASEPGGDVPAYEGLYASYQINLSSARAYRRQDLARLRWRQIRTDFPAGGRERVFEGPPLSLVLAEAGIRNRSVRITSFDGYEVEVEAEMIARHDPILAIRQDGSSLPTGGLGPVMLVWPRGNRGELTDMPDDLWPWGVFAITVMSD